MFNRLLRHLFMMALSVILLHLNFEIRVSQVFL